MCSHGDAMATKPVQQEHLEAAWRALRRPAWPDTLAATMQDPARAHPLAHARKGYESLLGAAARAGFAVEQRPGG